MYLKDNHEMSGRFQAYMLKYDSTHGLFKGTINVIDESTLEINGKQIKVTSQRYSHSLLLVNNIYTFFSCETSFSIFYPKHQLHMCLETLQQFLGVISELTML